MQYVYAIYMYTWIYSYNNTLMIYKHTSKTKKSILYSLLNVSTKISRKTNLF